MIGNIVEIGGEPQQLRQIARRKVGYCPLGSPNRSYAHVSEIKPIPITEELLLRNGFDEPFYRTDTKCSTQVRSLENGCELWARFHVPRKYWYLDVVNEEGFILSSGKVDYLHQLQNLCNIAGVEMKWMV